MVDPLRERVEAARAAALALAGTSDEQRRRALKAFAQALEDNAERIEQANAADVTEAEEAVRAGAMSQALLDRLRFSGTKIGQAAAGVRAVADQADPLGRTVRATLLDDGLKLYQVTVPIGVVACAFESRPDAAVQVSALAMRTGNAMLLKGGKEAARSNAIIAELAREALHATGLPRDGIVPIADRAELQALLALDDLIDLIIPRGSNAFVRFVQDNTRVPVLGHADGICHTYIDDAADRAMIETVCLDAKLDYPAACNATETFLVHEAVAGDVVPSLVDALAKAGVEVRADEAARALAPAAVPASEADWASEHGDLVCGLRIVSSLDAAIEHINRFGSGHTDAILTQDAAAAARFLAGVDAAGVYVNASTRFADGYRYGLGAEVGISTGKVHARGPVGIEGLTTTKWLLLGAGHTAGAYQGQDAKPFKHEPLGEEWHGL